MPDLSVNNPTISQSQPATTVAVSDLANSGSDLTQLHHSPPAVTVANESLDDPIKKPENEKAVLEVKAQPTSVNLPPPIPAVFGDISVEGSAVDAVNASDAVNDKTLAMSNLTGGGEQKNSSVVTNNDLNSQAVSANIMQTTSADVKSQVANADAMPQAANADVKSQTVSADVASQVTNNDIVSQVVNSDSASPISDQIPELNIPQPNLPPNSETAFKMSTSEKLSSSENSQKEKNTAPASPLITPDSTTSAVLTSEHVASLEPNSPTSENSLNRLPSLEEISNLVGDNSSAENTKAQEVKVREVKTQEVKAQEVKTQEVKAQESKAQEADLKTVNASLADDAINVQLPSFLTAQEQNNTQKSEKEAELQEKLVEPTLPVDDSKETSIETATKNSSSKTNLPEEKLSPEAKAPIIETTDHEADDLDDISPIKIIDQQLEKLKLEAAQLKVKNTRLQKASETLKKEIEQKQYSAQVIDYSINTNNARIAECEQQQADLTAARGKIVGT